MEQVRILVADGNAQLRERLGEFFRDKEEIAVCDIVNNGAQVLAALSENCYDVLLMDIILQQVDGFGVLDALASHPTPPRVIVMTALSQDDIIHRVCEMGAYYYLIKPFSLDMLFKRVLDAAMVSRGLEVPVARPQLRMRAQVASLEERISTVFLSVGIPAHIKGYHFLREAVLQVYRDRSILNSITKRLYPGVAEAFSTSASKVERAIRHAIEVAWSRGKIENINAIIGTSIYTSRDKPTNGEFIALIAEKLANDDLSRNEGDKMAV